MTPGVEPARRRVSNFGYARLCRHIAGIMHSQKTTPEFFVFTHIEHHTEERGRACGRAWGHESMRECCVRERARAWGHFSHSNIATMRELTLSFLQLPPASSGPLISSTSKRSLDGAAGEIRSYFSAQHLGIRNVVMLDLTPTPTRTPTPTYLSALPRIRVTRLQSPAIRECARQQPVSWRR